MTLYFVYILECADGSYYTGITSEIENRLAEHQQGADPSAYTFSRRPVTLKYHQEFQRVEEAIQSEKQIKGWSRAKKQALISGNFAKLVQLAKNKTNKVY